MAILHTVIAYCIHVDMIKIAFLPVNLNIDEVSFITLAVASSSALPSYMAPMASCIANA
jgi:hypothetical protein